jgi:hypothetical protein
MSISFKGRRREGERAYGATLRVDSVSCIVLYGGPLVFSVQLLLFRAKCNLVSMVRRLDKTEHAGILIRRREVVEVPMQSLL